MRWTLRLALAGAIWAASTFVFAKLIIGDPYGIAFGLLNPLTIVADALFGGGNNPNYLVLVFISPVFLDPIIGLVIGMLLDYALMRQRRRR